jgi:hypothetical protein
MAQTVSNVPLADFSVKAITDATSSVIQEVSSGTLLSIRIDDDGTTMYVGFALPGSATSAASWRIFKFISTSLTWADGDTSFDNIWDNHASLTYT